MKLNIVSDKDYVFKIIMFAGAIILSFKNVIYNMLVNFL